MSKDSSNELIATTERTEKRPLWGPFAAIVWTALIYVVPQIVGGLLVSLYPALRHWDPVRSDDWMANAISAQFVYGALAESMSFATVWLLLRHYKGTWLDIGFTWPKVKDALYAFAGFGVYFAAYIALVLIASALIPSFNIDQQQNVGFDHTAGAAELLMAFLSLVILPPLVEETVFRGFLFKGLRRKWSFRTAAVVTSALFAAPHLIEGVGGLLWVGGLDTFVLSIVLCYLRERTGRLAAGMGVHALKNGLAFTMLFVFHVH